jgi:hypothetical protein
MTTKTIYDPSSLYREVREYRELVSLNDYKDYLYLRIDQIRELFFLECKLLALRTDDFTYWTERAIADLEKQLYLLGSEVKIVMGKKEGLSPEMIAKAREYPITELVKVTRGMALCPFHGDKRPSMDVRKNFYHCYSCGESGDSIDLAMKIKNLTFTQAVTFLS